MTRLRFYPYQYNDNRDTHGQSIGSVYSAINYLLYYFDARKLNYTVS